jgi:hypothetical protein
MRLCIWILGAGLTFGQIQPVQAAPTYPTYQTEPLAMLAKGTEYYLRLFQATGKLLSLAGKGDGAFISSLYVLLDSDDKSYTLCGGAVMGSPQKSVVFVVSHENTYLDVTDDGWRSLGCLTQGGTVIKWVPRKDGSGGNDIRAFHTPVRAKAPPPAVPPAGPLPFGTRQRLTAEFEDSLSQILGAQVTVLSDRNYIEQDGSTTSCTVGIVGGHRFRIAESGHETPVINPTAAKWAAAGCTRPGYQLMR